MGPKVTDTALLQHRELAKRIAESRCFSKSARQRGLLQYLCNNVLDNPGRELHEQEIGVEFFRRDPGYDTNLDNVVRVNVSELRKRLAQYFETEGTAEAMLLEIPKGGYIPRFAPRPLPQATLPPPPAHRPWLLYVVSAMALLFAVFSARLWSENHALRHPTPFNTPALRLLWSRILPEGGSADLVVADSCLSLLHSMLRRPVSLQEYVSSGYVSLMRERGRQLGREEEADWLTSRRYTSLADVNLVATILAASQGTGFTVHFARDYQADRLRTANVLLVGSKQSNPWVEAFEDKMNFRIDSDEVSGQPVIYSRQPKEGESATYRLSDTGPYTSEAYSIVAFLPNQTGSGNVMIIAGSGMQGTRAAVDLVTSEREFARLLDRFGKTWPGRLPHFEVLLKTRIMGGSVRGYEFLGHRTYE